MDARQSQSYKFKEIAKKKIFFNFSEHLTRATPPEEGA